MKKTIKHKSQIRPAVFAPCILCEGKLHAVTTIKEADGTRREISMEEMIYGAAYGSVPPGFAVHHRDHDTLNNTRQNLELMPVSVTIVN